MWSLKNQSGLVISPQTYSPIGQYKMEILNKPSMYRRDAYYGCGIVLTLKKPQRYFPAIENLWQSYINISNEYFAKLQPYFHAKFILSSYSTESALVNLTIFEQIGILSTIGLNNFLAALRCKGEEQAIRISNANIIAESLCALISNNPASGSPRLDENSIDITLALTFLFLVGKKMLKNGLGH